MVRTPGSLAVKEVDIHRRDQDIRESNPPLGTPRTTNLSPQLSFLSTQGPSSLYNSFPLLRNIRVYVSLEKAKATSSFTMAPTWSRALLFPEPSYSSAPMWDRPAQESPIFIEPVVSPFQMWNRPSNDAPIFIDPVVPSSPMWNRPATSVPMCPCCVSSHPIAEAASRPASAARPSTSSTQSQRSLRSMPSSLGLRLKKSFRNLRTRASAQSL